MYYQQNCGCSGLGATITMAEDVSQSLASITRTLRSGTSGPDVAIWQGFIGVAADGKFGPNTAMATAAWQRGHNLTADGVVGPATKAAAIASLPRRTLPPGPGVITPPGTMPPVTGAPGVNVGNLLKAMSTITRTLRSGMTGPDVATWQTFLKVPADGKFGPKTAAATIAWQRSKGLAADGVVGPASKAAALKELSVVVAPVQPAKKKKAAKKKAKKTTKATVTTTDFTTMPVRPPDEEGMGTGTKILIGVGVVAVIGAAVIAFGS